MLYKEFLEGTKAKDTDYNHKVFRQLEALYMVNDNMTKEDVYKAAKTLIDNSETETEKKARELVEEAKKDIVNSLDNIEYFKREIERKKYLISISISEETDKTFKDDIKWLKGQIQMERRWIRRQKDFIRFTQI